MARGGYSTKVSRPCAIGNDNATRNGKCTVPNGAVVTSELLLTALLQLIPQEVVRQRVHVRGLLVVRAGTVAACEILVKPHVRNAH